MEKSKAEIEEIILDFEESYTQAIKTRIALQFEEWITTLNDASAIVSAYVEDDLAGLEPDDTFLADLVDNDVFEGLTYGDLLDYYVAQHLLVISSQTEFDALCPACSFGSREFYSILNISKEDAYDRIKSNVLYVDMLENYGDFSRLTYQESTNRIIYEYYGHLFNNQFYESYSGNSYDLRVVSTFERERGSILSLINAVIPRAVMEFIPFFNRIQQAIINLEESPSFISFMESTNLDLLINSISTNAVRSLVLVVLYTVVYILLIVAIGFLSIVLINLYGNVYESATRKRIKELASLRVLGTSYEDIRDMISLENRRVAIFSYLSFVGLLFILSNLNLFTDAPIKHYFMPLLGLFFDFNLYDVFVMNFVVIGFVTIVFYFFIYRFVINRVSTKKIMNIDTIQAIRDGDNL